MNIEMENLKALISGMYLSNPQKSDASNEFYKLIAYVKELEKLTVTHSSEQLLCISSDFNFLTKGKTYKKVKEPVGHYVVIDDFGEERLLWKKYFKEI